MSISAPLYSHTPRRFTLTSKVISPLMPRFLLIKTSLILHIKHFLSPLLQVQVLFSLPPSELYEKYRSISNACNWLEVCDIKGWAVRRGWCPQACVAASPLQWAWCKGYGIVHVSCTPTTHTLWWPSIHLPYPFSSLLPGSASPRQRLQPSTLWIMNSLVLRQPESPNNTCTPSVSWQISHQKNPLFFSFLVPCESGC